MKLQRCRHETSLLLPFYVNGSLEGEEADAVLSHIEGCPTCSSEVRELSEFSRAISRHGLPAVVPLAPVMLRLRLAYVLAVVLALPAALGIYWLYLGVPHSPSRGSHTIATTAHLDLGAGVFRSGETRHEYVASDRFESVEMSFFPPVGEGGDYLLELCGPAGDILARRGPERLYPDALGRVAYTVPSALLAAPGEYRLLLRKSGSSESGSDYTYSFAVARSEESK